MEAAGEAKITDIMIIEAVDVKNLINSNEEEIVIMVINQIVT